MEEIHITQVKKLIQEQLVHDGYHKGFDFSKVELIARECYDGFFEAGYEYYQGIVFFPKNSKFITHYMADAKTKQAELKYRIARDVNLKIINNSKLYPGEQYFQEALDDISTSLIEHHIELKYNGDKTLIFDKGLQSEIRGHFFLEEKEDGTINFVFYEKAFGGQITFNYNIKSGEVKDFHFRPPMPLFI